MQRMLVGLVLLLTGAVAVLGAMVYRLQDDVAAVSARRGAGASSARAAVRPDGAAARVESLDERLEGVVSELAALRAESSRLAREQRRLEDAVRKHRRLSAGDADGSGSGPGSARPSDGNVLASADRARDGDGGFVITEEDEEFFVALQKRVDRRRRIDGMSKNLMRRVRMLEQNAEIDPLDEIAREGVANVLAQYVQASDDLVSRFVRNPDEEHKKLTAEERREAMARERGRLVDAASVELERLLGSMQAEKVIERTIARTYRFRRTSPRFRGR